MNMSIEDALIMIAERYPEATALSVRITFSTAGRKETGGHVLEVSKQWDPDPRSIVHRKDQVIRSIRKDMEKYAREAQG